MGRSSENMNAALRQSQRDFHEALDLMVKNCINVQMSTDPSRYPVMQWISDWCTVRAGGHRRSGHTTSAIEISRKYFKNVLFISLNEAMAADCRRVYRSPRSSPNAPCCPTCNREIPDIIDFQSLHSVKFGHVKTHDAIVVDEASYVVGSGQEQISMSELLNLASRSLCEKDPFCLMLIR